MATALAPDLVGAHDTAEGSARRRLADAVRRFGEPPAGRRIPGTAWVFVLGCVVGAVASW